MPRVATAQGVLRVFAVAASLVAASPAAAIDPNDYRGAWTTDFTRHAVPYVEILSGGPPKDGIPSIDDPRFVALAEAELDNEEPVIGVVIGEDARAYPLRVLIWHEIVNDTVGGQPVAVTYCPLCNAALVFEREVDDEVLDFGTTGLLRNSDLIMYDRQSESWWQQFTGEAIVGARMGQTLDLVPARLESFARFAERAPQGRVLVPTDPNARRYGDNPYVGYDSRAAPYPLYTGTLPDDIDPMSRVVVVRGVDDVAAVTLDRLRRDGELDLDGVVLRWSAGQSSALDDASVAAGRDVGNVVVRRGSRDLPYDVTFAFVLHAFDPNKEILR